MAALEYLAREFKFSASNDGTAWTEVKGINTWGWAEAANEVDITDFDDAGYNSSMNASLKCELSLRGNYLIDAATGARDPGQKLVESAARKLGPTGFLQCKIEPRDAALSGSIQGTFRVAMGDRGGGNDDKLPWDATLTSVGKPTYSGIFDPDAV